MRGASGSSRRVLHRFVSDMYANGMSECTHSIELRAQDRIYARPIPGWRATKPPRRGVPSLQQHK